MVVDVGTTATPTSDRRPTIEVIDDSVAAADLLDPLRARILELLTEPGSATTVAKALGLPRQQVNYHLRLLEEHGLLRLVEERPRRGATERIMTATATGYLLSPALTGEGAGEPERMDRLSASYLIALAARMVREVAELTRQGDRAATDSTGRGPATLAIDTEIRFASPSDRAAFARDVGDAVVSLAQRYHRETAPAGRWHRLVVASHPFDRLSPDEAKPSTDSEQEQS